MDTQETPLRVELRQYLYAAVRELEIDTSRSQGKNSTPLEADMRRWFIDRWANVAKAVYGKGHDADTLERILRGSYKIQQVHLQITHDILRLGDYGLTVDELWKAPEETELRYSVDEFQTRLREVRAQHHDPLHLLRQKANSGFVFHLEAELQRHSQMLIFEAENDGAKAVSEVLTIPSGASLSVRLVPRVDGRLLLLSYNANGDKVLVLNEQFGISCKESFGAGKFLTFRASKPAKGDPGERDIIAVNWPLSRDPLVAGLQSLFDGKDHKPTVADLRKIGGELLATEGGPETNRVSAAMLRINLQ